MNCHQKTPAEVEDLLVQELNTVPKDALVTLRLFGTLRDGRPMDIPFSHLIEQCPAYAVLKNTYKLTSPEYEQMQVREENIDYIESSLITEHCGQSTVFSKEREVQLAAAILSALAHPKQEGMTKSDFEKRIKKDLDALFTA